MRALLSQFARFGVVGGVGLVVDIGIFNLLRATILSPEILHEGPLLAKIISTTVAIACNWLGNRHWTFHEHRGRQLIREGLKFAAVSVCPCECSRAWNAEKKCVPSPRRLLAPCLPMRPVRRSAG